MMGSLRDAALHIPLGLGFAAANFAAMVVCGVPAWLAIPPSLIIAGKDLFMREVTQEQADYNNDIRAGWNPFMWGTGKNIETWVPIAALLVAAWLTS